jgi:oligosaccharide repeat unit polymerase
MGSIFGVIVAVGLLPEERPGGENLILPAVAMSLGVAAAPLAAMAQNLKAVLRLEHILPLSMIYWLLLEPMLGDSVYPGLTVDDITLAYVAIGVFTCGCYSAGLSGTFRPPRVFTESSVVDISPKMLIRLALLCFALGIYNNLAAVGFNPIKLLYFIGVGRWSAPWASGRMGGWGAFSEHLTYFGYLVPVLTVTLGVRIGWLRPSTVLLILASTLLLLLLAQGGGRRVVGVMAGAPLIAWVLAQRYIDVRRVVIIAVAVASILGFMEMMLEYRNRGLSTLFDSREYATKFEGLNIDDNFYRLAQTIKFIPDKHPYVYHQQVLYTLVRPIPRVLWPGKPVSGGFELAQFLGVRGLTLSSTVVAEWYASGGMIIVFVGGVLYGIFARAFGRLWASTGFGIGRLLYGVSAMALFAGVRSMTDLVLMSYILLAWLPCWWFIVKRPARRNIRPEPRPVVNQ